MIGFERVGDELVAECEEVEVALLASLVGQVSDLLGAGADAAGADQIGRAHV